MSHGDGEKRAAYLEHLSPILSFRVEIVPHNLCDDLVLLTVEHENMKQYITELS